MIQKPKTQLDGCSNYSTSNLNFRLLTGVQNPGRQVGTRGWLEVGGAGDVHALTLPLPYAASSG